MLPFRPPPPHGVPVPGGAPPRGLVPPPSMGAVPPMVAMRGPPPRGPPPMMFPPVRGPPSMVPPGSMMPGMIPRPLHPMVGVAPPGTVTIAPVVPLPETGPLNVFVGKLPTDLNDSYVRNLLENCGTVIAWKRTTDPVTCKPKGFGYCTFAGAIDVLRALRLLNGFSVDSKQILVKVDTKTQAKLDEFTAAMTEKMKREEQQVDEHVASVLKSLEDERSGLMGGIQNHPESWGDLLGPQTAEGVDGGTQASDTTAETGERPPIETKVQQKMILSEIEKFRLAQEQREQDLEKKRREAVRERLRRDQEEDQKKKSIEELAPVQMEELQPLRVPEVAEPQPVRARKDSDVHSDREKPSAPAQPPVYREHKLANSERDDEREQSKRHRDRDRRKRTRSYSRSRSRGRSSRRRRRDRSSSSSESSRSRSRSRSRDRGRRRERHRDRDRKRDRDREHDHERRHRRRRNSSTADNESEDERRSKRRRSSRKEDTYDEQPAPTAVVPKPPTKLIMDVKMSFGGVKKEKALTGPAVPLFKMDEEVVEKPVREFVRIDFAEEARQEAAAAQQRAAATVAKINSRTGDLKALIEQIPTDTKGLFAYPIDWSAVDKHDILKDKMRPWLGKKVVEYLGEEDETMVQFVLTKLQAHAKPTSILDEIRAILEDEAEVFVKLLWRKLAFEAVRASSTD